MKTTVPPRSVLVFLMKIGLGLELALASGCLSAGVTTRSPSFDADGVYVRHLRIRLVPSHTPIFEAMLKRCVEAASTAEFPESHDWLCYREPPGRYWLLFMSDTKDGFVIPPTLACFVDSVSQAELETTRAEILAFWSSFHETDSLSTFIQSCDEATRQEYSKRDSALMETTTRVEHDDGNFVDELSRRTP